MKAQMQKGFTLIELMIVVAIIGILAAVAIPQYQNYVGRANFASALSTVTSLKTNIESHIMEFGEFPTTSDDSEDATQTNANLGMDLTKATDLGTVSLTSETDGAGKVVFLFSKGSPGINNQKITLSRSDTGTWTCETGIDAKYAKGCTTTTTPPAE